MCVSVKFITDYVGRHGSVRERVGTVIPLCYLRINAIMIISPLIRVSIFQRNLANYATPT